MSSGPLAHPARGRGARACGAMHLAALAGEYKNGSSALLRALCGRVGRVRVCRAVACPLRLLGRCVHDLHSRHHHLRRCETEAYGGKHVTHVSHAPPRSLCARRAVRNPRQLSASAVASVRWAARKKGCVQRKTLARWAAAGPEPPRHHCCVSTAWRTSKLIVAQLFPATRRSCAPLPRLCRCHQCRWRARRGRRPSP